MMDTFVLYHIYITTFTIIQDTDQLSYGVRNKNFQGPISNAKSRLFP